MEQVLENFYKSLERGEKAQRIVSDERRKRNQIEKDVLSKLETEMIIMTDSYMATTKLEKNGILQDEFKRRLEEEGFDMEQIMKICAIKSEQRKVTRLNVVKKPEIRTATATATATAIATPECSKKRIRKMSM